MISRVRRVGSRGHRVSPGLYSAHVGRRPGLLASPPVRVHARLPLPLPAAHDGSGPPHRRDEGPRASVRGRTVGQRGAILDPDLRSQLRRRRGHRHSDGVPVRNQLGTLRGDRRSRRRPHARDGGAVRLLSRVELPEPARLGGKTAGAHAALPRGAGALRGELAVRLVYRLHERLHAAPVRARGRRRRRAAARELLGVSPQPVGDRRVRAHDDRGGRHGVVRRRRGGCLLRAASGSGRPLASLHPSSSRFPRGITRPSSWQSTSRQHSRRWRAASRAAPRPGSR